MAATESQSAITAAGMSATPAIDAITKERHAYRIAHSVGAEALPSVIIVTLMYVTTVTIGDIKAELAVGRGNLFSSLRSRLPTQT